MAARKSPDAFRTISEVADWLGVNAHVLRFWESKFSQIKPVKRAGGRRYYRKSDMELLGGIKQLLHEDGLTIKGAQKVLREQGVKAVCALSKPVDSLNEDVTAGAPAAQKRGSGADEAAPSTDIGPNAEIAPDTTDEEIASAISVSAALNEAIEQAPSQPTLFDVLETPVEETARDDGTAADDGTAPDEVTAPERKNIPIAPLPPLASEMDEDVDPDADLPEVVADDAGQPEHEAGKPLETAYGASAHDLPPPDTDRPLSEGREGPSWQSEPGEPTTVGAAAEPAEGPRIAPLPGPELTVIESLGRVLPGQISPADLAPILRRAKDLRARMDAAAAE